MLILIHIFGVVISTSLFCEFSYEFMTVHEETRKRLQTDYIIFETFHEHFVQTNNGVVQFGKDLLTNDCILNNRNTVNKFSKLISKDFSRSGRYKFTYFEFIRSLEVQIARWPMTTSGICRRFIWARAHRY